MKSLWVRGVARVSPRERRALVLGLGIVVPALFAQFGASPYLRALSAMDQRLVRERELLQRELSVLGEAERYPVRAGRLETVLLARAPRLFGGSDLLSAAGALSRYVTNRKPCASTHTALPTWCRGLHCAQNDLLGAQQVRGLVQR